MENNTMTTTAWTPSVGMSTLGRPCAHLRAFGAGVVAVQGDAAAIVRVKGDFPGSPAWSPSS